MKKIHCFTDSSVTGKPTYIKGVEISHKSQLSHHVDTQEESYYITKIHYYILTDVITSDTPEENVSYSRCESLRQCQSIEKHPVNSWSVTVVEHGRWND